MRPRRARADSELRDHARQRSRPGERDEAPRTRRFSVLHIEAAIIAAITIAGVLVSLRNLARWIIGALGW